MRGEERWGDERRGEERGGEMKGGEEGRGDERRGDETDLVDDHVRDTAQRCVADEYPQQNTRCHESQSAGAHHPTQHSMP